MFSHVSVHPSFCLSTGGVPQPGPARGGTLSGVPLLGGGGYPTLGTPNQTWPGGCVPGFEIQRGVLLERKIVLDLEQWCPLVRYICSCGCDFSFCLGYTPLLPRQTWPGGYPAGEGGGGGGIPLRATDGVFDTPRSVCVLRSSRTFLLNT